MHEKPAMILIVLSISLLGMNGCGTDDVSTPLPTSPNSPAGDVSSPGGDGSPPTSQDTPTDTPPEDNSNEPPETNPELTFMDCGEAAGDLAIDLHYDGTDLRIEWGEDTALGVYVTDPDATLPQGPGQTVSGTAYWVLEMQQFPAGFAGPVTYGVVPEGADETTLKHGGEEGADPLMTGVCYKVCVVTTSFQPGIVFIGWEYR